MFKKLGLIFTFVVLFPLSVLAASSSTFDVNETVTILGKPIHINQVNGFLEAGVAATDWILGIIGSVSLLMFVWGGFQLLISQGEKGKIDEGKKIMTSAIIGIIIVFSSYIMIKFVVEDVMGMSWKGGNVETTAK